MRTQRLTAPLVGSMLLAAVAACGAPPAAAQGLEHPGVRARGMAGAFVAVADDATAAWWNPAGLATIRFLDASLDVGAADVNSSGDRPITGQEAGRWRQGGFFFALPVLGISLNRVTTTVLTPSATAAGAAGRQDQGPVGSARVLRTTHVGVTLVQSITDAIVVGSTVRVIRGRAGTMAFEAGTGVGTAFELADEAGGRTGTRVDTDLGLMAVAGVVRLGIVARNVGEASFDTPEGDRLRLERQLRVGVAAGGEPGNRLRAWQVAADADLLATDGPDGERRTLAVGAERWWAGRRVGLRGGGQVHTVGDARPAASVGGSAAVWSGLLVEGQVTAGGDRVARGWGVSARVAF
jgi:hypothetical protein